jgi:hypothetical protein
MSQLLPYLLILVCPLTMSLMMWVMMRRMNRDKQADPRVAELESQLSELRSAVSRHQQPEAVRSARDGSTVETV